MSELTLTGVESKWIKTLVTDIKHGIEEGSYCGGGRETAATKEILRELKIRKNVITVTGGFLLKFIKYHEDIINVYPTHDSPIERKRIADLRKKIG